jgi:uncharacterized protein (DUF952 family)
MAELFHLTDRAAWVAAEAAGVYLVSTRGVSLAEQGFIHCSLRHQVRGIADALFAGVDDVVLLVIDSGRLSAAVRYEPGEPGGEDYPHVYGPLTIDAVTAAIPLSRAADGTLELPPGLP